MPDILIRGMEMPKSCADCPFEVFGDCNGGKVKRIMDVDDYTSARAPRCPLLELPPHGDLIDRDALKHKFCTHCDGYEHSTGACVDGDQDCMDAKIIMTAPAVVPSNKEETE